MSDEWQSIVADVVHKQCTSPDFATYCVSHVTDPRHLFLFSQKDCPPRQRYVELLASYFFTGARCDDACERGTKRCRSGDTIQRRTDPTDRGAVLPSDGDDNNDSDGTFALFSPTWHTPFSWVSDSLFAPCSKLNEHSCSDAQSVHAQTRRCGVPYVCVTWHTVHELWDAMRERFVHTEAAKEYSLSCLDHDLPFVNTKKDDDNNNDKRNYQRAVVHRVLSPHAPHPFMTVKQLSCFVEDVAYAAQHQRKEDFAAVINFMQERRPMTESFVMVLVYLVQLLLTERADMRRAAEESESESGSESEAYRPQPRRAESGQEARMSRMAHVQEACMNAAQGVVYVFVMLLHAHHAHDAILFDEVVRVSQPCALPSVQGDLLPHTCPNKTHAWGRKSEGGGTLYYQDVFDYYCVLLTRAVMQGTKAVKGVDEGDAPSCGAAAAAMREYMCDSVHEWIEDRVVSREAGSLLGELCSQSNATTNTSTT